MPPIDASAKKEPDSDVGTQLCKRVADLRKGKGWTLEELASASGVSRSMLSEIERGRANPTLGVAHRIASAFGLSLGDLVQAPAPPPRIDVIRADDRAAIYRSDAEVHIRTLSPLHLEKDVEFYEVTLKPRGSLRSAAHFHGTREVLTVTRGAVKLSSAADSIELKEGDSAHYPADVPHSIENLGDEDAVILLVDLYRGA